jgi:hypothetical protein
MRHVAACTCCFAMFAFCLHAGEMPRWDFTIVMNFEGSYSPQTLLELKQEADRILAPEGISIEWVRNSEAQKQRMNDLAFMTFRGTCQFRTDSSGSANIGPYAFTHVIDGDVLHFGDVDCDRVANAARSAMTRFDFIRGDFLLGRALGRVVAHELVHMITQSVSHGLEGVQKPALSGKELIDSFLPLRIPDIQRTKATFVD